MQKIAIDMDEVMADTWAKFIDRFRERENLIITPEMLYGKEMGEAVPPHLKALVYEWINERGFFRDLPVMADAQTVIKDLSKHYEIFIVSAASEFKTSYEDKYDWLAEHFSFIPWSHIVFCGDKSIIGADVMIDDRVKNFKQLKGRPLLYNAPHNVLVEGYERVHNWAEVAKVLL